MALVVGGTTVTGTQTVLASVLTGTASAINGSNITNLPAPSSANVASATAGIAAGAVGSYAAGRYNTGTTYNAGDTLSSGLTFTNFGGASSSGGMSGTWRCMGRAGAFGSNDNTATVWLRIS